ncbi:hypothetical protein ANN_12844 [Periplaneta americana]|uniref:Uncharacterized protein n=1 Tax=Periplaneta americana TaxID=6978 RepID=A0ABQ8TJ34_PERAM|nr:hypothetical protein ANN_12844 [Periplaneta americana]
MSALCVSVFMYVWFCLLSTPFEAVSVLLMLVATMFALMGHFNSDHKTLVACGLYILGAERNSSLLIIMKHQLQMFDAAFIKIPPYCTVAVANFVYATLVQNFVCYIAVIKHNYIRSFLDGYLKGSPDLTPLSYCIRKWMKGIVYQVKVQTRVELLQRYLMSRRR